MNYERKWVLSQLELLLTLSSKNHQVALSTVLLNYCVMYHKTGQQDGVADCSKLATQVLKTSFDQQAKLRALIGLGSLVLVNKASVVSSALPDNLTALLQSHCTSDGGSQVSECAQYVLKAMK
jgi:hypothetical protein